MATKFITVSIEIMHDSNLNNSQKFMLAEIEQLCSLESGCFASNSHFAELIGITKENVSRNLNDLKEMGYIDIKIENGSRNHTRIVTLTNLVIPPYQNSKTPLLKQQETKENIQSNIQSNIIIEPCASLTTEIVQVNDFDTFWKHYPKKVGKDKALQSWNKKKHKPHIELIIEAVQRYKLSKPVRDGFVCLPATWINEGRWSDEVELSDYDKAKAIQEHTGMSAADTLAIQIEAEQRKWEAENGGMR